jgi:5-hydroxyisourate hydrolase
VTTLSTHVLDLERGAPAAGVQIELFRDGQRVAAARTDPNGRIADLGGGALGLGTYAIVFEVAAYLADQGRAAPFLQRVTLEITVDGAQAHYHVPLLMTPYACTTYRGS